MACASSQRKQPSFSSTKERLLTISQFLAHETQGGGKAMDRSHADKRSRRELLDEIEALKAEVATLRARPGSMTGGMTGGMTEYAPDGDYTATGQIVDIASVLGVLRSRGDLPPVRDPRLDVNARRQFEFSRSIMGAMVEGVVVLDHQGLLRQINPAASAMLIIPTARRFPSANVPSSGPRRPARRFAAPKISFSAPIRRSFQCNIPARRSSLMAK